jgi:hypothetical protein
MRIFCLLPKISVPYSVMTHIAVIDSAWESMITPMIQQKFPHASKDEILQARKFAYGGCIIQDLGYYPGGSKIFSDLLHYVRSGDFVQALIQNSETPADYAFALAALSHYASDNNGHALATNRAVPILYPELRKKFGDEVTFDEKPSAHLKVEFGYDVVQVARGKYASDNYHDIIGFDVPAEFLKKTFRDVYGLSLTEALVDYDTAIGSYRWAVTGLIPDAIKIAWELKKDEIEKMPMTREQFFFRMPKAEFEKPYGKKYIKPSLFSRIVAFFVKVMPPIGPLKILRFKPPTPEVESMFIKSYDTTLTNYKGLLKQVSAKNLNLINKDLDTGKETRPGEYRRTDDTYVQWVDRLSRKDFATVDDAIKQNILTFYANPSAVLEPELDDWKEFREQLDRLQAAR